MPQEGSEIAHLMREIEQRTASARMMMESYAEVASHDVIQRKMESIGVCRDRLEQLVGAEEAGKLFVQAYCSGMDQGSTVRPPVIIRRKEERHA